ncbi:uncharacterized protein TNCV_273011 [Trichonephila clavipes]|nr:uncharacterized protein TNCV_273011 [Trichonephila clavipes]
MGAEFLFMDDARQPPPTCVPEHRRALLAEWCNIAQDQIDNLILSMPRRWSISARPVFSGFLLNKRNMFDKFKVFMSNYSKRGSFLSITPPQLPLEIHLDELCSKCPVRSKTTEKFHWCAKIKDEVEKLAYQLNEDAERTERPIRRLSKVMYGSTCADMQVDVMGECLSSIKHVVGVRSVFLAKRLHAV